MRLEWRGIGQCFSFFCHACTLCALSLFAIFMSTEVVYRLNSAIMGWFEAAGEITCINELSLCAYKMLNVTIFICFSLIKNKWITKDHLYCIFEFNIHFVVEILVIFQYMFKMNTYEYCKLVELMLLYYHENVRIWMAMFINQTNTQFYLDGFKLIIVFIWVCSNKINIDWKFIRFLTATSHFEHLINF